MAASRQAAKGARGTKGSSVTWWMGATLSTSAFVLGGCSALLPRIPVAAERRTVVAIDGRGGTLCGAFDTGEAFCGSRVLPLPYDKLNERHTGRALQVTSNGETICVLFESGDVWCDSLVFDWHFVERPRGIAFQSILVGSGYGCGVDSERNVECWGSVAQDASPSLLESLVRSDTAAVPREPARTLQTPLRVRGLEGVRELRSGRGRLCALAGNEVICMDVAGRRVHDDQGFDYDFGAGESFGAGDGADVGCEDAFGGCASAAWSPSERTTATWTLRAPRRVPVERARSLASAGPFGCAVDADNHVSCWGVEHQLLAVRSLQSDAETRSSLPMEAIELEGAADIEFGTSHACARSTSRGPTADPNSVVAETNKAPERADQLWCWGNNESGQLGNAVNARSSLPVRVQGLDDVDAYALAGDGTCAISRGELWCWGRLAGLPALAGTDDDPCRDPRAVCVPHQVVSFETDEPRRSKHSLRVR